ncbi:hypothetical protein [Mycoplasmopsis adleri]|uniref:hypothetical protein n=1 Tax=Mycoplasmopsis adleri TaxID=51362 RepID=UPI0038733AAD
MNEKTNKALNLTNIILYSITLVLSVPLTILSIAYWKNASGAQRISIMVSSWLLLTPNVILLIVFYCINIYLICKCPVTKIYVLYAVGIGVPLVAFIGSIIAMVELSKKPKEEAKVEEKVEETN